jgi:hypothetical protein
MDPMKYLQFSEEFQIVQNKYTRMLQEMPRFFGRTKYKTALAQIEEELGALTKRSTTLEDEYLSSLVICPGPKENLERIMGYRVLQVPRPGSNKGVLIENGYKKQTEDGLLPWLLANQICGLVEATPANAHSLRNVVWYGIPVRQIPLIVGCPDLGSFAAVRNITEK